MLNLLALCFGYLVVVGAIENVPEAELSSLIDIYAALNGTYWSCCSPAGSTVWDFTDPYVNPCVDNWQLITCTVVDSQYHIRQLGFSGMLVSGTLPETLNKLSFVEKLAFASNHISGSIPSTIGTMTQLSDISLYSNSFTGTIPINLGSLLLLTNLELEQNDLTGPVVVPNSGYVSLQGNSLNGSIPMSIGGASQLTWLNLYANSLTGSLPHSLCSLTRLKALYLQLNLLTGFIPSCLSDLNALTALYLGDNNLNGTIPVSVGEIVQLEVLDISNNCLTGSIPSSLMSLSAISILDFQFNLLTGSIPKNIGNATLLQKLYLNDNSLDNHIPESLQNLSLLQYFIVSHNNLNGTIPSSLGYLSRLMDLKLDNNGFSNVIPTTFGGLTEIFFLFLNDNFLSGTIPDTFENYTTLTTLDVHNNFLSGGFPSSLGQATRLDFIFMSENCFDGTIPSSLNSLTQLMGFSIYDNSFSGVLPDFDWSYLESVDVSGNDFTGMIPHSFSTCSKLIQFVVGNNHFSGSLDGVFNPSLQVNLVNVQVDHNQLTGSIPPDVFLLVQLTTFVAVRNCFYGQLPSSVCECANMTTLILDGMSSATSCQRVIFPSLSSAYLINTAVGGSVPDCIYQLRSLQSLHLSGNAFDSSLPQNIELSPSLMNLAVSHNKIRGTIGGNFQNRMWQNLDLSHNKLTGSLLSSVPVQENNSILSLTNNRLSGRVPNSLVHMEDISILESNMFDCPITKSDLPEHDDGLDKYQCGSVGFNIPIFVWVGLIGASLGVFAVVWYKRNESDTWRKVYFDKVEQWLGYTSPNSVVRGPLMELGSFFRRILRMTRNCVFLTVVIFLPLYSILGLYYATYQYEYAWYLSSMFKAGAVPFSSLFCSWVVLMYLLNAKHRKVEATSTDTTGPDGGLSKTQIVLIAVLYALANLLLVGGVNVAYVYVTIYGDASYFLLEQISLSLFKLVWNVVNPVILHLVICLVAPSLNRSAATTNGRFINLQIGIAMVNNILIPCLVVLVVSPSCFYNVFVAAPAVETKYPTQICEITPNSVCFTMNTVEKLSSYDPPFMYNYQCSARIVTYYAPTFAIMCITSSFFIPLAKLCLCYLHKQLEESDAVDTSHCFVLINALLPPLLKPPPNAAHNRLLEKPASFSSPKVSYFNGHHMFVVLSVNLGLLLTFGVVFPPLSVAFALNLTVILYSTRIELGRFVDSAVDKGALRCKAQVEEECSALLSVSVMHSTIRTLTYLCCCFYSLFLFDVLGDTDGYKGAFWVLVAMPCLPILLYFFIVDENEVEPKCALLKDRVWDDDGRPKLMYAAVDSVNGDGDDINFI